MTENKLPPFTKGDGVLKLKCFLCGSYNISEMEGSPFNFKCRDCSFITSLEVKLIGGESEKHKK